MNIVTSNRNYISKKLTTVTRLLNLILEPNELLFAVVVNARLICGNLDCITSEMIYEDVVCGLCCLDHLTKTIVPESA